MKVVDKFLGKYIKLFDGSLELYNNSKNKNKIFICDILDYTLIRPTMSTTSTFSRFFKHFREVKK